MAVSSWYALQFHQDGQSPYAYKLVGEEINWIEKDYYWTITFMNQIDTLKMNKHSYTCNEDNQNHFMHCVENYYSKRLGCLLPWSIRESQNDRAGNVCKGKDKFREYQNISMNIQSPEETKELIKEGCFIPNCLQRSWEMKKEKYTGYKTGFTFQMYENPKVLLRREVKLYTLLNFFGEVGGYLGLLLGESLVSYIIMIAKWVHVIGKKLKEKCRKDTEEKGQ